VPNWSEEVTAIATAVSAIGFLSAIGAAVYAGQQVREARIGRQAEMAADFFRRWNEGPLEETRRLVDQYGSSEALRDAFARFVADAPSRRMSSTGNWTTSSSLVPSNGMVDSIFS